MQDTRLTPALSIAGLLTLLTGWDYFRKSLPYLKDEQAP